MKNQDAEWPRPIRTLPPVETRVETGPVQFGGDWPGIFIRGDNAAHLAMSLRRALSNDPDPLATAIAESVVGLLESCIVSASLNGGQPE